MSQDILLISDNMLKERTVVHGNIDAKLIYPDIKAAQDMYIHPILGTALYDKLLADIAGSGPQGDYKILIDRYIVDTLIYYTLSELPLSLSFQFWNKGLGRTSGDNMELPSMSEISDVANNYQKRAEFYANRLRLYLKQNAATKFPEYINPGSGIDTMNPANKAYTCPVWLGDDDCAGRTYEERYQGNKPNCCD